MHLAGPPGKNEVIRLGSPTVIGESDRPAAPVGAAGRTAMG